MQSVPWWMWILGFLLVLGPLVTVHELGHYLGLDEDQVAELGLA